MLGYLFAANLEPVILCFLSLCAFRSLFESKYAPQILQREILPVMSFLCSLSNRLRLSLITPSWDKKAAYTLDG
jgi:hypothetical protein